MDKYEYNVKSDQIKKLYSRKEYEAAAKIADEIDWVRVKDNTMINRVADIYENVKQYEKAKDVLLIAYERSPLGRQLAYKLTILALRTKNFVEADEFYQDFVEMSPSDVTQYLLKYRIAKAKGEDIEVLIRILEAYVEVEMDERWQYELAKLYHEAGEDDKCIAMCDELELWFNDGKYVEKAKELRKLITGVLSEYNKRYANDNDVTPSYSDIDMMAFEDNSSENEADSEIAAFAKALVESEENEENQREDETEIQSYEEEFENLDDNLSDEEGFLDDEMSSEESNKVIVEEAAKEVARMANAAETAIPVMTEEERIANEALKAAEEAALEAQKAADMARQLVEEARAKAFQAKNVSQISPSAEINPPKSNFSGMNAEQISKALEDEDLLKGDAEITSRRDSMIEIFEFDKSKDGKCSNIGEELTKTAEIDIEEINIKLEDSNNLYNTANIQEALAKSMEKILDAENNKSRNAFSVHIDDDEDEIRLSKPGDTGYVEEGAVTEEVAEEQEEIKEPVEEEAVTEEVVEEQEEVKEPVEEEAVVEEPVTEEVTEEQEEIKEPVEEEAVTEEVVEEQEEIKEPVVEELVTEEIPEEQEEIKEPVEEEAVTEEVVEEQEEVKEPVVEEPVTEEVVEEQEEIKELVEEEPVVEEDDSYLDDEEDTFKVDEPTKRIDRDEINRILNASKNIYQNTSISELFGKEKDVQADVQNEGQEDEQIKGQMTIDEVLAEYERIEAEKEAEDLRMLEETAEKMEVSEEVAVEPEVEEVTKQEVVEIEEISESEEIQEKPVENITENVNTEKPKAHKIPEDYRSMFNDFVGTGSMEEDIAETLDNLIYKFSEDGTSKTNNVIITGSAKIGKTTLGLSLIKAANRGRNRSGRRVAKVKASALNKRGVTTAMSQILGTDLIIEQAGNLMPNTLVDLMIAMKNYTEEMLIILEDDEAAIDRMLNNTPDLKNFFTNRLDIREMEIDDMVKIAKDYAAEEMYTIDEIGELALYAKLDDISGRNPVLSIEDIQEVIDDAIEHSNRFSIGKLFGRRKASKGEMGVLTEQDFM